MEGGGLSDSMWVEINMFLFYHQLQSVFLYIDTHIHLYHDVWLFCVMVTLGKSFTLQLALMFS